ncbi:MAG: hypothetical protein J7L91_05110 [Candidatus Korarchaeota archaeon]|nr:hypothetical protein [Candidatus Korarchaeota archaeon]
MRKRCRHDIIETILEAVRDGRRGLTEICTYAGIPVDRGKKIMELLVRYGLLVSIWEKRREIFEITPKGYEWLGIYRSLESMLPTRE